MQAPTSQQHNRVSRLVGGQDRDAARRAAAERQQRHRARLRDEADRANAAAGQWNRVARSGSRCSVDAIPFSNLGPGAADPRTSPDGSWYTFVYRRTGGVQGVVRHEPLEEFVNDASLSELIGLARLGREEGRGFRALLELLREHPASPQVRRQLQRAGELALLRRELERG